MDDTTKSIWRLRTVITRTALSRSTIYDMIARGTFPPPVLLSRRSVGWRSQEIENWIASRPSKTAA
jgi:prophage regulatory protein